jgi:ABC-2 type transport system ATP-binding protein
MLTYNPEVMEFAVETRGLTRTFGAKRAVDGIDLRVPAGSFYGFLGPNGAGKSTTIKCLTGLLRPSGGEMRILGLDPLTSPVEIKRRVGVVPEDLALFDRLTASETLKFVAQVHGIPGETYDARSADLLSLMDLTGAATTLVADFSHGMRKKLSLAAALLPAPRLLFLDEPFEGIDAVASRQIKELLHAFVARGGTIFLTSHILEIVERLSTHIGVIADGRLVAQGRIDEVRAGSQGTGTLEELFIALVGGERPAAELNWL